MELYPYSRIAVLYLQNDVISDGYFTPEIARTLREYAEMIDKNEAGREHVEVYSGPRGTRLIVTGATRNGEQIP